MLTSPQLKDIDRQGHLWACQTLKGACVLAYNTTLMIRLYEALAAGKNIQPVDQRENAVGSTTLKVFPYNTMVRHPDLL